MEYIIIILICFGSSVIGSVCGIGGGVIIKPVLDAAGIMSVDTINFLSGFTVLSMAFVSVSKNIRSRVQFNKQKATLLAVGAAFGGLAGKAMYQLMIQGFSDSQRAGAVQAGILMVLTVGTLIYTVCKKKITTWHVTNRLLTILIGCVLGILSSFLGIGGGPINLVVLFYFFSMETKQAAAYSLYIIMFSQCVSVLTNIVNGHVPQFPLSVLILMILCGITGGMAGSKLNRSFTEKTVNCLFLGVMGFIILISIYNIRKYF